MILIFIPGYVFSIQQRYMVVSCKDTKSSVICPPFEKINIGYSSTG